MAIWKVFADRIRLFPHPTSEFLRIGKIGRYQVVVNHENDAKDGDIVVFAPERSIIPEELRSHYVNSRTGESFLTGDNHDRVRACRMRKVLSEGVTLPMGYVLERIPGEIRLGEDISEALGIHKYKPEIPAELAGEVFKMPELEHFDQHDVEQSAIFSEEFTPGEPVLFFEKVHGVQASITRTVYNDVFVTSKGLAEDGFAMFEASDNKYWKAVKNSGLYEWLRTRQIRDSVQIWAEVFPAQRKSFTYGAEEPTLRIYRARFNGVEASYREIRDAQDRFLFDHWVPLLYEGPFDMAVLQEHAKGKEMVSGKQLHIREGGVVSPKEPRLSSESWPLYLKVLNPKFEGSDDDLS